MLYNKRIKILLECTTKVNGRPINSLVEFYSCWCNISSLSSTMQYKAMQAELENTLLFNIKYCNKLSSLDSVEYKDKLFVEFRGKKYRIYLVDMKQFEHQDITLKGIEVI
ncbi:MAG: phage head closure protein [Bacillota bacterium]|nr:phage head closure protein [Bacillota bacterium]